MTSKIRNRDIEKTAMHCGCSRFSHFHVLLLQKSRLGEKRRVSCTELNSEEAFLYFGTCVFTRYSWNIPRVYEKDWSEMKVTHKWPLYNRFWPFFCHMYVYLAQNWGSEGDMLNGSILNPAHFHSNWAGLAVLFSR